MIRVASILGVPAIYADGFLYWFAPENDERTRLARALVVAIGTTLVSALWQPAVERAALAAWGIKQIDRAKDCEMTAEHWFGLEDCRVYLWQIERQAARDLRVA